MGVFTHKGSYDLKDGPEPTRGITEARYIFSLMVFFGHALAYTDRMVLNVAIVGMVDRSKVENILINVSINNVNSDIQCSSN